MTATGDTRADAATRRIVRRGALQLALGYAFAAATWIVVSDAIGSMLDLPETTSNIVNTGKGILFVVVTATLLYLLALQFLARSHTDAEQLRLRDRSILQAYIDVLDAVTGGRLILMWPEDLDHVLGDVLLAGTRIAQPSDLSASRERLTQILREVTDSPDDVVLAVSEGLTNVLKHAGSGEFEVRRKAEVVQVVITDHGPGIDFQTLPKATLIPGFSTKPSLGMGFTIMLDLSERLLLTTRPGLTKLVLEFPCRA